jgi:O-antigen/teichoic acid export membrane protein
MLTGFVQQTQLTRIVGMAEYGAFSVVNSIISILNNTVVQSTIQSVSKFTAQDDRRAAAVQRAGLRMQAVLGSALGLAMFAGAPLLAAWENAPHLARLFRIASVIPFLYAFYAVFVGSANGLRRFRTQASFDVGFSTAKTILLLGCAMLWQVSGAFAGFGAAAVIILVVASRVMRLPAAPESAFPTGQLVPFMSAMVLYNLPLNLAFLYDVPFVQHLAGAVDPAGAGAVAASYGALRTLALLPYQFLLVITFVIFPLISRSTFAEDRAATRLYVTQTLRVALILVVAMGLLLGARPGTLLGIVYPAKYGEGAAALPILVAGECCLGLLAVSCSILNAAGRTRAALVLMSATLAVGAGTAAVLVPRAAPGAPMLVAAASATSLGMAVGFVSSVIYMRARLGGSPPLATVARVGAALLAAALVGRFLPGHGKILGLAAIAAVGVVYAAVLFAFGELGPDDRAKLRRMLARR